MNCRLSTICCSMRIFSPDRVQMMMFGVASSAPGPPLFRARHPDEYVAHQNRIPRRQEAEKFFFFSIRCARHDAQQQFAINGHGRLHVSPLPAFTANSSDQIFKWTLNYIGESIHSSAKYAHSGAYLTRLLNCIWIYRIYLTVSALLNFK